MSTEGKKRKERSDKGKSRKRKRHGKRYGITAEQFVTVWQSSGSIPEVKKRLEALIGSEVPLIAIYSRANQYRQRDIDLKQMRRPHTALDIAALNALAKQTLENTQPIKRKVKE
jgi:hypothetical protein